MLAFTDTAVTKIQLVESLERHAAVDAFIKGQYWSDGKGCAVGCSLHDFHAEPGDHAAYEPLFGIPQVLARLEDGIFEGLPIDAAKEWPLRFARAILAERERCARVVEDYEPDMKPWDGPTERANARSATDYACIDLAAAIRGLPNG